jgi:CRISPR system Cascade subunit CasC
MSRFIQIHTLTSYPASLLNRDDAGFAKRIPFGGATRTRISSQCLKRHWRTFDGEGSLADLGVPMSVRSRLTFEQYVVKPLLDEGVDAALARAVTAELMEEVLGQSAKAKAAKEKDDAEEKKSGKAHGPDEKDVELHTGQITVLGRPEMEYLLTVARKVCSAKPARDKVEKAVKECLGAAGLKNLGALGKAAGLDAGLFGRMVTSDNLARGDAAVHVAHAFTVHAEASESDYFSAVDDLLSASATEQLGSGHIGSTELTSGLFYGYVAVDVPLLVSNLEGCKREVWTKADRTLAARVVERLVQLVATVSPGAKLGSTAPHSYAHLALVESGNAQPRTLGNAFLRPVAVTATQPDLVENAYRALAKHTSELDAMYGPSFARRLAAIGPAGGLCDALKLQKPDSLAGVATWAAGEVRGT